mgnify:CR=1 FL=1
MSGEPPHSVRAYLRRVTCLIPPRAARVVQAELLGHLHLDMLNARLRGLDEKQAWAQALRDAGPAPLTALRFARTYTLGLALGNLLPGAVREMVRGNLGVLEKGGPENLRLRLCCAVPALAALPWEFLYLPPPAATGTISSIGLLG